MRRAMIFAAGLGTRLGDITRTMPKALVEVGGEPMLKRVILKLKRAGVREFVINVHHYAQSIIDYLAANDNFGVEIHISDETDILLDTGGGLLKARHFFDGSDPVIVHNADILTDFDIEGMYASHVNSGADATLLVARRETSRYLLFDNDYRMVGWKNIKTGEVRSPLPVNALMEARCLAFGGVHIVNPSLLAALDRCSDNPVFSITPFYTDMCGCLRIQGFILENDYIWIDIGKPTSLKEAENIVSKFQQTLPQG